MATLKQLCETIETKLVDLGAVNSAGRDEVERVWNLTVPLARLVGYERVHRVSPESRADLRALDKLLDAMLAGASFREAMNTLEQCG